MKLIELTETQYRNYSRIHKEKNYCQTVEYTNLLENKKYNKKIKKYYDELEEELSNIEELDNYIKQCEECVFFE